MIKIISEGVVSHKNTVNNTICLCSNNYYDNVFKSEKEQVNRRVTGRF